MIAYSRAVFHGNAALFIYKYAQITLRGQLKIHQLVTQARQSLVKNILNIHVAPEYIIKKWPCGHFSCNTKNLLIITRLPRK